MLKINREKLFQESKDHFLRQLSKRMPEQERKKVADEFDRQIQKVSKVLFGYEYHKEKCPQCGRRILVQIILNGTSHNVSVSVVCSECLEKIGVGEEFKKERPEEAKDIESWLAVNII